MVVSVDDYWEFGILLQFKGLLWREYLVANVSKAEESKESSCLLNQSTKPA